MQNYLFSVDCANHSPRFLFYIAILSTFLTTQRCTSNLNLGTTKQFFSFPSIRCSLRSRLCLCSAKLFFDKKRTSEEVIILRSNPVDVSREHGAFFDVGDAEEAGSDALETDGEAAVRGHAVAEGVLSE